MFSSFVHFMLSLRISRPLFNKISWLCRYHQPGEDDEASSNDGCNSGATGHDFTTDHSSVCTGNLIALVQIDVHFAADWHHLTRAALFQSMLDGRDISIQGDWQTPQLFVFKVSFNHVKLCQLQLGAAFMLNLNARVHKISGVMVEWWCKSVKS